jgi:hypothetical protein
VHEQSPPAYEYAYKFAVRSAKACVFQWHIFFGIAQTQSRPPSGLARFIYSAQLNLLSGLRAVINSKGTSR